MNPSLPVELIAPSALLLAWVLDASFGEPRNAWHPVAWLGRLLGPVGRMLCRCQPAQALIGGALAWLLMAAALGGLACLAQRGLDALAAAGKAPWQPLLAVAMLALLVKPCFAWRMLRDEVAAVDAALAQGSEAGRARVARLVSRDVSAMDAHEVRETAIETLAENLNDSVVAPLFWFAVAGLPGAVVYRFANTADAMWGYRGRWEWAGRWAARADDVLSWLPARLTAVLVWPFGGRRGGPRCLPRGWRALASDAALTPSPNGGWPMGAMALRLGVRLRKPGVYALNAAGRSPEAADMASALVVAGRAAWLALGAAVVICGLRAL
jgi:adenosylcobinamide-phosphate synthase